jgi:hypothetical protein
VGVRRIHLTIDRVVLTGFQPAEARALASALESQLLHALADKEMLPAWARPHHTPVLKLGRLALPPGAAGARSFGRTLGTAIGRGLKP